MFLLVSSETAKERKPERNCYIHCNGYIAKSQFCVNAEKSGKDKECLVFIQRTMPTNLTQTFQNDHRKNGQHVHLVPVLPHTYLGGVFVVAQFGGGGDGGGLGQLTRRGRPRRGGYNGEQSSNWLKTRPLSQSCLAQRLAFHSEHSAISMSS